MGVEVRVDKDTKIDIAKCPHVLIGGSTGSGKSYLMKCMLSDILRSGNAKVIVLDPKSVDYQFLVNDRDIEFGDGMSEDGTERYVKEEWIANGLMLMDRDSIDSMQANKMLNELVKEMQRRYSYMKQWGCVDWQEVMDREECVNSYSSMFGKKRIILMVDELADLMYFDRQKSVEVLVGYTKDDEGYGDEDEEGIGLGTEGEARGTTLQYGRSRGGSGYGMGLSYGVYAPLDADTWKVMKGTIEGCLIKIATLGRAAGIHLVLGTQRPDASILSGQLRANIPCRICLRVSNKMERRIILGDSGLGGEREILYLSKENILSWDLR